MLHGIFFHRLFGVIKPSSIECLDVTFPAVKDENTEMLVDETVEIFLRALQAVKQGKKEGQIEVFFTEKQQKKGNWFQSDRTVCHQAYGWCCTSLTPATGRGALGNMGY